MDSGAVYAELGRLVRAHRERLGLSQAALAERVGLSRTSITNIEQGRQKILLHQLFALAQSLAVRPEALLPSIDISEIAPQLEQKLGKHLKGAEREWARRIVLASSRGGVSNASRQG